MITENKIHTSPTSSWNAPSILGIQLQKHHSKSCMMFFHPKVTEYNSEIGGRAIKNYVPIFENRTTLHSPKPIWLEAIKGTNPFENNQMELYGIWSIIAAHNTPFKVHAGPLLNNRHESHDHTKTEPGVIMSGNKSEK